MKTVILREGSKRVWWICSSAFLESFFSFFVVWLTWGIVCIRIYRRTRTLGNASGPKSTRAESCPRSSPHVASYGLGGVVSVFCGCGKKGKGKLGLEGLSRDLDKVVIRARHCCRNCFDQVLTSVLRGLRSSKLLYAISSVLAFVHHGLELDSRREGYRR